MYQVNILDSNYYPVRQVKITSFKAYALYLQTKLLAKGILAGIMYFD